MVNWQRDKPFSCVVKRHTQTLFNKEKEGDDRFARVPEEDEYVQWPVGQVKELIFEKLVVVRGVVMSDRSVEWRASDLPWICDAMESKHGSGLSPPEEHASIHEFRSIRQASDARSSIIGQWKRRLLHNPHVDDTTTRLHATTE